MISLDLALPSPHVRLHRARARGYHLGVRADLQFQSMSDFPVGWMWWPPHGGLRLVDLFAQFSPSLGGWPGVPSGGFVMYTIITRWGERDSGDLYVTWNPGDGWRQYLSGGPPFFQPLPYDEISLSLCRLSSIPPEAAVSLADRMADSPSLFAVMSVMES